MCDSCGKPIPTDEFLEEAYENGLSLDGYCKWDGEHPADGWEGWQKFPVIN